MSGGGREQEPGKGRIALVDDRGAAERAAEEAELVAAERALRTTLDTALGGGEIGADDHEALIALVLGDEVAGISADEQVEAELFRRALEGGAPHPLGELGRALAAAARPSPIDEVALERAIRRALGGRDLDGRRVPAGSAPARPARRMVLGTLVALAAGLALFIGSLAALDVGGGGAGGGASRGVARAALVRSRSTQELFDHLDRFPRKGGESERVGRIVAARAADLRANRFAAWGVR